MKTHLARDQMKKCNSLLRQDVDLVHCYFVDENVLVPSINFECNIDADKLPPAYRQSVINLRAGQRLGHYSKQKIFKRSQKAFRAEPKSYPIPPRRS
jgi:hypothetical protein